MLLKIVGVVFISLLGKKCYKFILKKKHHVSSIEDQNLFNNISEYLKQQDLQSVRFERKELSKKDVKKMCYQGTNAELFYENLIKEVESMFKLDEHRSPVNSELEQ